MLGQYNQALEKKLNILSIVLSVVVLLLVGIMRRVKIDLGVDFSFLPPVHALLNTGAAISLVMAYMQIRKKNYAAHRNAIFAAMGFSALFLLCYVLYHFTTVETKYCGVGGMRVLYFVLLISHIVLAGISLPFILLTFSRGITNNVEKHKKMARYVFPVWLYVAIMGLFVICFCIHAIANNVVNLHHEK